MINVGLESIVSKVLQGGSVTYKVKLYDELLEPVLAQENITVSFDYVLSGITQGDFSNLPISTAIPIGSSEVMVSLDSINGGVVSIGSIAVSIQNISAATGEYEAQLIKDNEQISLQVAEKQVKINIGNIAVVKEGDASVINIDVTNMDGSPTGLYSDVVVELGYTYPNVDAASIAETGYVNIDTTGNSSTSIQTYYTPYGNNKSVTVSIVGAYSSQDSDWVVVGTSTAELVVTGEVQLSINEVVGTVYEGGILQCKAALSDMLGNPVECSTPVSTEILYTYSTALANDTIPVSSAVIESGSSEVLVNIPTTKNVYQEGFKAFRVDLGTVSGGSQFSNFTVLESFVNCVINDEIVDYDPLNSESRDPVIVKVESSSNEVEYGSFITYTVSTKDISGNDVVGVDGLYVPIVKEFYYENTLVSQEDIQVYISYGDSQVTTTTNSLPLSGNTVDRVDIYIKNDINSVTGYEQYEQVILDDTPVSVTVAEEEISYLPEFTMVGNSTTHGNNLVYNVTLNPNTEAASYYLIRDALSTANLGIDYTTISCTNGVLYSTVDDTVTIPAGVEAFDVIVSTVTNEQVGKEDRRLTLVINGTVSASATISNVIASVVSVGDALSDEGTTLTHEVIFADVFPDSGAIALLSNVTTRVGDIESVSVYYMDGGSKVYVPNVVDGSTFTFDIKSTSMYIEIGTKANDIYEDNKTYRLDVGIIRNNPDAYHKSGIGTLLNTTTYPVVSAVSSTSVQEGSTAQVVVSITNVSSAVIEFPISLSGTALADLDYDSNLTFSNGVTRNGDKLIIPPYTGAFNINVEIIADDVYQTNRYLDVEVGGVSGRIVLINEEDKPSLSIGSTQVVEGGYGVITLSMSKASSVVVPINIEFNIAGQSASITDYVDNIEVYENGVWVDAVKIGSRYLVSIPSLAINREIRVKTNDNNVVSGSKTIVLNANVQGEDSVVSGTITVLDKDTSTIDVEDVVVNESVGNAIIPITMSKENSSSVSIAVVTEDITADSGDYTGVNTIITFPAGSTRQELIVPIKRDGIYEGNATFRVVITNVVSGTSVLGKNVGIVTIIDEDLRPKIKGITSASVVEGSSASHIVTISNGSKFTTDVDVLLVNNGASIGEVYSVVDGIESLIVDPYITNTIQLSPLSTSFSIKVNTVKDGVYRGASGYTISAAIDGEIVTGNGIVTDENERPKISLSSASAKEGDNLVFYVYLDRNTTVNHIVPFRLEHVTTTASDITGEVFFTRGVSYDEVSGNITIPSGIRTFEVVVPTVAESTIEGLETLRIVVDGVIGTGTIAGSGSSEEPGEDIDSDSNAIVTINTIDVCTQGLDDAELKANNMMVTSSSTSHSVCVEDLDDLDITVAKKEYVITGDDIYIPQLYDDAPQWMKDLVQLVVDVSMTTNNTQLVNDLNRMLQEFAVSYVPLNQYTQSIVDLSNEDERLMTFIETINSNFNDGLSESNAQIINLMMTKASKDEVLAQVIQTLAAELANPNSNLGATVVRLEQAITTEQTARATSFQALTASMESIDGSITANAEVLENALAYVGIDEAGASTGTGLSAYLEASDGTIGGADSQLANTIRVTAEGVESKWAYNSIVNINGVYRKSGFGLTSNNFSGNGTQTNPYTSEFWIDATKLRFTNSNMTGRTAPFTIDASGTTPQIKFNGVVEFSNVANVPQLGSTPQQVVNAINNGNTTTINGSKITTGSITAAQIQANSITAREIQTNSISADRLTSTNGQSTVWTGGGLVSANFNGNVNGNIGSPTQGFRLSSNAAGTSANPNIYGAYIKASTMEFLYAGIPGTNNSGRFNYSATASGGGAVMLVSPTYGSGYADNRITSLQNSIITVIATVPYYIYTKAVASTAGYLQRSINGAGYVNISSQSTSVDYGNSVGFFSIAGNFVITYRENLANLGNFGTLFYRASNGGTVMVTLNN